MPEYLEPIAQPNISSLIVQLNGMSVVLVGPIKSIPKVDFPLVSWSSIVVLTVCQMFEIFVFDGLSTTKFDYEAVLQAQETMILKK